MYLNMIVFIILLFQNVHCLSEKEILNMCNDLYCNQVEDRPVCGVRYRDGREHRMFDNECKLMLYGCNVSASEAYGLTDIENCKPALKRKTLNIGTREKITNTRCPLDCPSNEDQVCGIRTEGTGFVIRIFINPCQLTKYNCELNTKFYATDAFVCKSANESKAELRNDRNKVSNEIDSTANQNIDPGRALKEVKGDDETTKTPENDSLDNGDMTSSVDATTDDYEDETQNIETTKAPNEINDFNTTDTKPKVIKQEGVIVVDTPLTYLQNINSSINNFFASTHVFDLPIKEIPAYQNPDFRKRLIKIFGPLKVYRPWVTIPKNISEDVMYKPTLSSCYHRCPEECPDSYAPVCGVPGIVAREPSLMFQNHCYMDAAQCKMIWDDASDTAQSSAYIESSFVFCLGDTLNAVFRFLPLVRTLQHMGRLKKKGRFRSKLRNMKFFNEMVVGAQPKFMGKK